VSAPDDALVAALRDLRAQWERLHKVQQQENRDLHDLVASLMIRLADMESRMDGLATALLNRHRGEA
jgi:hypothetical protein